MQQLSAYDVTSRLLYTIIKDAKCKFYILKSILKLSKVVRYADSKNFAL